VHEPSDHVVCVHALAVDDPTGQHIQLAGVFDNVNFPWASNSPKDMPTVGHRLRELAGLQRGHWEVARRGSWPSTWSTPTM